MRSRDGVSRSCPRRACLRSISLRKSGSSSGAIVLVGRDGRIGRSKLDGGDGSPERGVRAPSPTPGQSDHQDRHGDRDEHVHRPPPTLHSEYAHIAARGCGRIESVTTTWRPRGRGRRRHGDREGRWADRCRGRTPQRPGSQRKPGRCDAVHYCVLDVLVLSVRHSAGAEAESRGSGAGARRVHRQIGEQGADLRFAESAMSARSADRADPTGGCPSGHGLGIDSEHQRHLPRGQQPLGFPWSRATSCSGPDWPRPPGRRLSIVRHSCRFAQAGDRRRGV